MRRAIIALLGLIPLVVAYLRSRTSPLFFGQQSYSFLLEHAVSHQTVFLVNALFLVLLVVLIALLQKKYQLPDECGFVLLLTPTFLASTLIAGPQLLFALLTALALFFWKNNHVLLGISIVACVVHPTGVILSLLSLIALAKRKQIVHTFLLLLVFLLFAKTFSLTFPPSIVELGDYTGTSIVILFLGLTGVFFSWKKNTYPYLAALATLSLLGLLINELSLAGALSAASLAGIGMEKMKKRQWYIEAVQHATLLFVTAGLVYAGVAGVTSMLDAYPTAEAREVATILLESNSDSVYVSEQQASYFIWRGVPVRNPERLFAAKRFNEVRTILPDMIVLHEMDDIEGISFLIEHTNNFFLIHKTEEYTTWEVRT